MEYRKEELKALKKASQKMRSKKTAGWKTVALISLLVALILALVNAAVLFFDAALTALIGGSFGHICGLISTSANMIWILAAVFAALFLAMLIPWSRGKRQWKRSQEYLDYKTMKTALALEKEENN